MGAKRTQVDLQRLFLCRGCGLSSDVAVFLHLADNPVAPLGGALGITEGMVVVWSFRQGRKICGFLYREVFELFIEIVEAGRRDTI